MSVVNSWNNHLSAEVDAPGLGPSQSVNLFCASDRDDAFASYRKGLVIWMGRIAGENLAVEQEQIGRRLLACARLKKQEECKSCNRVSKHDLLLMDPHFC